MNFKDFTLTTKKGWKDKGYRTYGSAGWEGKIKKDKISLIYGYGHLSNRRTKTLGEFLFVNRNDILTMGEEITVGETDSTRTVKYEWTVDPLSSDSISTGILTDSLRKIYPAPNQLYKDHNYYSFTKYNDSVYFIYIKVPEIVLNSKTQNIEKGEYKFNVVRPRETGNGFTKVVVTRGDYWDFSLTGENLDFESQEELINIGLSIQFKDEKNSNN